MKLVELAAKEVKAWPEFAEWLAQSASTGEIIFDADPTCGCSADFKATEIADDAQMETVSRSQWEAERARIAAMEGISAVSQEQANAEAERKKRTQYEQELWDRVAVAAIQGVVASEAFHNYGNFQGNPDNAAFFGAEVADAFMKECSMRAKQ